MADQPPTRRGENNSGIPWWRRKASRNEVVVMIALACILAAAVGVVLALAHIMGDRFADMPK
jgi:hypothetical protein